MQVCRTILFTECCKKNKLFSGTFPKATVAGSTAAIDPDRQRSQSHPPASIVPTSMSGRKSRTLELLASDEKSTF
jgi:hypothetical protein